MYYINESENIAKRGTLCSECFIMSWYWILWYGRYGDSSSFVLLMLALPHSRSLHIHSRNTQDTYADDDT